MLGEQLRKETETRMHWNRTKQYWERINKAKLGARTVKLPENGAVLKTRVANLDKV